MDLPIQLDIVKAHLHVTHDDEDNLILGFIKAAIRYAEEYQGRSYYSEDDSVDVEPMGTLEKQAVLLTVGHWYDHRGLIVSGNTIVSVLPMGAKELLYLRRKINV